jgi:hypothetical protein
MRPLRSRRASSKSARHTPSVVRSSPSDTEGFVRACIRTSTASLPNSEKLRNPWSSQARRRASYSDSDKRKVIERVNFLSAATAVFVLSGGFD